MRSPPRALHLLSKRSCFLFHSPVACLSILDTFRLFFHVFCFRSNSSIPPFIPCNLWVLRSKNSNDAWCTLMHCTCSFCLLSLFPYGVFSFSFLFFFWLAPASFFPSCKRHLGRTCHACKPLETNQHHRLTCTNGLICEAKRTRRKQEYARTYVGVYFTSPSSFLCSPKALLQKQLQIALSRTHKRLRRPRPAYYEKQGRHEQTTDNTTEGTAACACPLSLGASRFSLVLAPGIPRKRREVKNNNNKNK